MDLPIDLIRLTPGERQLILLALAQLARVLREFTTVGGETVRVPELLQRLATEWGGGKVGAHG